MESLICPVQVAAMAAVPVINATVTRVRMKFFILNPPEMQIYQQRELGVCSKQHTIILGVSFRTLSKTGTEQHMGSEAVLRFWLIDSRPPGLKARHGAILKRVRQASGERLQWALSASHSAALTPPARSIPGTKKRCG